MKKFFVMIFVSWMAVSFYSSSSVIFGQTITGLTGLYTIPTGETLESGKLILGANYLSDGNDKGYSRNLEAVSYYLTFGYLPFLEVGLRFTNRTNASDALGDRMFSARLKFLNESEYLPSVVFGAHDIFRSSDSKTNYYNATYFALTKNFPLDSFIDNIKLNAGYGFDLFTARSYQFDGPFGGVSVSLFEVSELLLEYDSDYFNAGVRFALFNHIYFIGGLQDMKVFNGGLAFSLQL
ncbi:MAG: YjbH domain-containing protein [Melioribacteraceae bacterium]